MNRLIKLILSNCPNDYISNQEIAVLLGERSSANARASLIRRLVKTGDLVRLKKGFFVLGEEHRRAPLNLFEISQFLYHPSYVGLHSALSFYGAIPEAVRSVTCISTNRNKEIRSTVGVFMYHHVNEYIFREGIVREETKNGAFLVSSLEKTILDFLFIHKRGWTGLSPLLNDLRFDEELIHGLDLASMENMIEVYKSRPLMRFVKQLKKDTGA